jgi:hypothetical protein
VGSALDIRHVRRLLDENIRRWNAGVGFESVIRELELDIRGDLFGVIDRMMG